MNVQARPRTLILDRQSALTSREFEIFATQEGMKLEFVAPGSHANGLTEGCIRTLKNKVISIMTESLLQPEFEHYAVPYATKLYNRTYHSGISRIPLEAAFLKKKITAESLEPFKMFGSIVFFDREKVGVFLGIDSNGTTRSAVIVTNSRSIVARNVLHCRRNADESQTLPRTSNSIH